MAEQEWERAVDLAGYCPEFMKEIRELKRIMETENEEFRLLYEGSDRLWKDGYIREATSAGIRRWETLLGIRPYPGDTLEERRAAVLGTWNQQLPYTLPRLHERLQAVVGQGGYELYLRHLIYELEIDIIDRPYRVLQSLHDMAKQMIPANLRLIFAGRYPVDLSVETGVTADLRMSAELYARYNREYLRLDGTWKLDNTYRLNNYKEKEAMEFYPAGMTAVGEFGVRISEDRSLCLSGEAEAEPGGEIVILLGGEIPGLQAEESALKAAADVSPGPKTDSELTVEHDKWLLNDHYKLDNTKKLDAYWVRQEL